MCQGLCQYINFISRSCCPMLFGISWNIKSRRYKNNIIPVWCRIFLKFYLSVSFNLQDRKPPVMCKLMEALVVHFLLLLWHSPSFPLLHPLEWQPGKYIMGKSTKTAVHTLRGLLQPIPGYPLVLKQGLIDSDHGMPFEVNFLSPPVKISQIRNKKFSSSFTTT